MKNAKKLKCVMCGSEEGSMNEKPFSALGEQSVVITRPCPGVTSDCQDGYTCLYFESKDHAILDLLTSNRRLTLKCLKAERSLQRAYREISETLSKYRENE